MEAGRPMPEPVAQKAVYEALRQKAASELDESEKPESPLHRIESVVVGGLAVGALALCSYNVVVRYFRPSMTLELVDEVQVYLIVWAVSLAFAAVTIADRHVKADLFVSFFSHRVRAGMSVFADFLGLAFGLMLLWYGSQIAYESWSYGEVSGTSLRFPLWIYVSALPAGGLMLVIGYLVRLFRQRRQET